MESNHFGSLKPAYRLATEALTVRASLLFMPLFAPWWPQVFRCDPAKPGTHSTRTIVIKPSLKPGPCEKTTVKFYKIVGKVYTEHLHLLSHASTLEPLAGLAPA